MNKLQDLNCKLRFAVSRLPYLPVRYQLIDEATASVSFLWSKVMPFFNHEKGLFNFELWGWDLRELRFPNKFLEPGIVFLDVGAYHGLYSIIAGQKVAPIGKVYAFEPTPSHSRRIQHHLRLNRVQNVKLETLALIDSDCYLSLNQLELQIHRFFRWVEKPLNDRRHRQNKEKQKKYYENPINC